MTKIDQSIILLFLHSIYVGLKLKKSPQEAHVVPNLDRVKKLPSRFFCCEFDTNVNNHRRLIWKKEKEKAQTSNYTELAWLASDRKQNNRFNFCLTFFSIKLHSFQKCKISTLLKYYTWSMNYYKSVHLSSLLSMDMSIFC